MRRSLAVILVALVAACARGIADDSGGTAPGIAPSADASGGGNGTGSSGGSLGGADGGGGGGGGGGPEASAPGSDATAPKDAAPAADAPPPPPSDSGGGGGLDPGLALPDPNGQPCSSPGLEFGCPGIQVCRLSSPNGGRCEGCTSCGNRDAPCTTTAECDILFECYEGICTGFCTLGTYECGAISDCVNVGHPTIGVCRN